MNNPWHIIKYSYHTRHEPEGMRTLMDALWYVLLCALAVMALAVMFYGGWVLWHAESGRGGTANDTTSTETITRGELIETLELARTRETTFEFLKTNPPEINNPGR